MYEQDYNEFLIQTLLSYKALGFKSYISYSTLYKDDTQSYCEYNIVLSKNDISYTDSGFHINDVSTLITVTGSDRQVTVSNLNVTTLNLDNVLCITSNALDFVGTDSLELIEYNSIFVDNFNLPLYTINFILVIILIYMWFCRWFAKGHSEEIG